MDLKLFNAILSMDSYNRGYNANIIFGDNPGDNNYSLDIVGTPIGNATIYDSAGDAAAQDIGFYAVAYDVGGAGKIIAYRGTDEPLLDIPFFYEATGGNDIWNGWLQGAGIFTSQAAMAFQFYNQVAGTSPDGSPVVDPRMAHIITTGHSLGGGLAGLVAGAHGKTADVFDNMPFELALLNTHTTALSNNTDDEQALKNLIYGVDRSVWEYDLSNIHATSVQGEMLAPSRVSQIGTTETFMPLDSPSITLVDETNLGSDGVNLSNLSRHSMSALVIRLFADTEIPTQTDWYQSAQYFWPVLFDDTFAKDIGMDAQAGRASESSKLQNMIAYSAIDEGTTIFGNTGIRALYNDANDFGKAVTNAATTNAIMSFTEELSKVFVQYAGELALHKAANDNVWIERKVAA